MKISHSLLIATAELKQVWNNKRFLFLLVVVPILISISFGFVAYREAEGIETTVFVETRSGQPVSSEVQNVIQGLGDYTREDGSRPFAVTVELNSREVALKRLDEGNTKAVVILNQGAGGQLAEVEVISAVGDTTISGVIEQEMANFFTRYSREISNQRLAQVTQNQSQTTPQVTITQANVPLSGIDTTIQTDAWRNLRYFDFYASAMIVIVAVGMPLLLSVISITSERSRGTIERIFVSPYSKSELIVGKVVAHSLFAVILAVLFVGTLKVVFNVTLGNPGLVMLLTVLVGINGAVAGLLVSSVTYSEAESVIIGIMGMLGIMALITYMTPWETMHPVTRFLSNVLPFTYGIQTIRKVNMVGIGFSYVWPNLLILFGYIIALVLISIPVLRREIK